MSRSLDHAAGARRLSARVSSVLPGRRRAGPYRPYRAVPFWRGRVVAGGVAALLAITAVPLVLLTATPAKAAGSTLFDQPFHNSSADGTGAVVLPALASGGSNVACLSAAGNTATGALHSCAASTDPAGTGKLRLTAATGGQVGAVFGATSVPTSQGLDVTFNSYQYGGNNADGITFVAAAVDPAAPTAPATAGQSGGALGYSSAFGNTPGLANAYLGVGLDVFGNFSNHAYEGSGCTDPAYITGTGTVPGQVVVRGPGRGLVGYCAVASTATTTTSAVVPLRAATRAASVVPVEVVINPTASAITTTSGLVAAAGTYKVVFTPVGGTPRTLTGTLPVVPSTLYPSTTWTTAAGIPRQLAFGWVASTGGSYDYHEIDNAKVVTFNPVPQLAVSSTSYNGATPAVGGPVTYGVTASVAAGADETAPVSVTETLPTGTVPVGAFGVGWVCQPPSGRLVTCTNSNGPFANGTSLTPITVVGIVTSAAVTAASIQSGTTSTSSSTDASPGFASTTTAGTLPTSPSGITVTPAIGTIAGGGLVTVGGANITGATAIEIGTTAEQNAGTPVTLLPCAAGVTVGCFSVSGGNLVIASMPARPASATVTVTVVTQGVAAAANYVYADAPGAIAAPTATAGITSATVTWVAPAANGSPITSYVITPYKAGVVQTAQSFDTSTTTRTLTGLTAGASYTFTVSAVNAFGTTVSPASNIVIPYALPSAPTITAVSAGTNAATLSWNAPSTNGSAITGYVVTPYIGGVAQAPQTFGAVLTATVTGLTGGTAYTFKVAAINAAGTGPQSAASASVTPNVSPTMTFAAPPGGEVNLAYSDQLTVSGGTAPYVWSVSAGTLPPGVTLSAGGLLAGTPTAAGSYPFTVLVTDASGGTASQAVTLVVAAALALAVPAPPAGEVGVAYSYALTRTGGVGPYVWSVTAGALPAGITLDTTTGLVSGTPTAGGSFSASVKVVDSFGVSVTRTVSVTIAARPTLSFPAPPSAQVGIAYTDQLTVVGGTVPFVWSVSAGSLPPGVTLDAGTGLLSGTPTTAGSYAFTITATDANGAAASEAATISVGTGPLALVNRANVTSAAPGARVTYTVTVTNTSTTAFTGVTVTDPLAAVLDDATYGADATATAGTVSFAASTLSWTGNVAASGSVTITFSVVVANPDTGNKILTSTLASSTIGTTCTSLASSCTSTVTVSGLTIVATADVGTTVPGGVVHLTVTVTNTGQTAFAAATFSAPFGGLFDDATYNGDASTTAGNLSADATSLTWTGALAAGGTATLTASFTVNNPDSGDHALAMRATSTTPGSNCPAGNTDSRCAISVTVLIPGLVASITADTATTTPGGVVHYTFTVTNNGQTPQTGVSVANSLSQVLTDAVYDTDAATTTGSLSYTAPTLTWTGTLAIGAVATITYSVTVRNPDPGDKTMASVLTSAAAGSNCPVGGTDARCSVIVTVLVPGLTIATTADAATATEGQVVHYTVTVTNSGQTAQVGATFTQSLAGVLDDATYGGNAAATAGSVGYAAPTLTWTGTLAVGAVATITYSVTVRAPDAGDGTLAVTAVSTTTGNNCPSGGTDSRCTATVRLARLVLSQSYAAPTTTPGSVVRLTSTFTNTGQTAYTNITVSSSSADTVDDAIPAGDQTATSGTLVLSPTAITWTGSIPAGGVVTITGTLTVKNPDTGNHVLTGVLVSAAAGNNCPAGGTDPRCTATDTVLTPGLTISNTANTPFTVPGGSVGYTLTITNSGQTPYTGAVVTSTLKVFDDANYNNDATATAGSVSFTTPTITWTGNVAVGAVVTITYSVTVHDPDTGGKVLVTIAASSAVGSTCPAGSANPACAATVAVLTPGLTITNTADRDTALPGGVVTWTIVVANTGQTAYSTVSLTDALGPALDDATYNADASATAGTVSYAAPTLSWNGPLNPGAVVTITFTTTVTNPDTGDTVLTTTVTSPTSGSNCQTGTSDSRCAEVVRVTAASSLTFTTTATVESAAAGDTVHYTITAANTALSVYTGATVTDNLTAALDDATYNNDAAAATGTLGYTIPNLTWTGNVPAQGSVTITFSVTVRAGGPGDDRLTSNLTSTSPQNNCPSGNADPRCTWTVTVTSLLITTVSDVPSVTPGGTFVLTDHFTNTGQTPLDGISVAINADESLDDASVANGDQTVSSGTLVIGATGAVWTGSIPVGGTVTLGGSITANNPDTGNHLLGLTFSTATPGSNCPLGSADTRCTVLVTVLTPGLTITNTADRTFTTPGGTVAYSVVITNSGQTPYTTATVTSPLSGVVDDAGYNHDLAATSGSATVSGVAATTTLNWTGSLAVGASTTITYTVTARNPDTGDKLLVNSVQSSDVGSTCPPASGNAACTASVLVLTPALTIVTATSAATTAPGGTVVYTVTVQNTGQVPFASANFTAPLTGVLDDATYNNNILATVGTATYSSPNLSWTGPLVPAAVATITWSVTVANPDMGNDLLRVIITSSTQGTNCVSTLSADPRCDTTVPVAILTILNTASVSTTVPGGVVGYTITLHNTGQVPYTGVSFDDSLLGALDDATYNGDATVNVGQLAGSADGVAWTGDIAIGATVTITGSVTVNQPDTGDRSLVTVASSPTPGSSCPVGAPGPGCTATTTVLVPALSISTTADRTTTVPGGVVHYTITVVNTGQTPYTGIQVRDDLANILNDTTYDADAVPTSGTVTYTAPTLTWTGDVAIGATVTVTFSVTVRNPDPGDKLLVNTVSSTAPGSTCPPGGTAPACSVSVQVLVPTLSIIASVNATTVTAGDTVHYTVQLANTGQTPYTGITVTDDLTGVLDDATYRSDAAATTGTVSVTAPTLSWTGDLALGGTVTITFSVLTLLPDPGNHSLTSAVASTAAGSTCPPASTDPACVTTVLIQIPALDIGLTTDSTTVVAGGTVQYSIALKNTGATAYTAATVTDSLAGVLDDGTYRGDATASSGVVVLTSPNLVWTGNLAVGGTVNITFSILVTNPDPGDSVLVDTVRSAERGSTCPPGTTNPACTSSIAVTAQAITLTGLTSSFALGGNPAAVVRRSGAVTMTVTTNSPTGYTVTVQAAATSLVGLTPGNLTLIPIGTLLVRESGTTAYLPVTAAAPLVVHTKNGPSAPGGDAIGNDFRATIPFVRPDTYAGTLNYVATTL